MSMNIVVVGSTFGSYYARSIAQSCSYNLMGIMGTGSLRSKNLAADLNVPLFTDIKDIASKIDLAIVAVRSTIVGGNGDDITRELLSQNIPVLQELPIHSDEIIHSLRIAKKNSIQYSYINIYENLPSIKKFINLANYIHKKVTIDSIEVRTCIHVLPYTLLILGQILDFVPSHKKSYTNMAAPYKRLISFKWSNIPVDIILFHVINPEQPNNHSQPLMSFVLHTSAGELSLEHVYGPSRWEPCLFEYKDTIQHFDQQLSQSWGKNDCTAESMYKILWRDSILSKIKKFEESIWTQSQDISQKDITIISHVEAITSALGLPILQKFPEPIRLDFHDIEVNHE